MIRYADILGESVVDGLGIRVTAFLQGCPRRCEGCHNPALLPMNGGKEVTEEEFANLIGKNLSPLHRGVTFTGGDPLAQPEALLKVIQLLKRKSPRLNIWVYTGFTFEEVKNWPVTKLIDVLVDGPFMLEQKDLRLAFRGSKNQRIINVSRSLMEHRTLEISLDSYSEAV